MPDVGGGMVMVVGLLVPVFVIGVDGLPAVICVLGLDGDCAGLPEAPVAEAPAAIMGEPVEGASSLAQLASSDPKIERAR